MSTEDKKPGKKKRGKPRRVPTEDVLRAIEELKKEQGRLPTSAAIATRLGITRGMVDNYIHKTPELRAALPGRRRVKSMDHRAVVEDFMSGKTQEEIGR